MHRAIACIVFALTLGGSAGVAQAACTALTTFSPGTTIVSSQVNSNFQALNNCASVSTRQVLTGGSSAIYTTPPNVRQLRIRMVGGGGGGGGSGSSGGTTGSNGSGTTFNSITAAGGSAGNASGIGGAGGTGGSGVASFRTPGGSGQGAVVLNSTTYAVGISGGTSAFGSSVTNAVAAPGNSGAGGGAFGGGNTPIQSGAGGGAGEYVELIINNPSATYVYTIGAGGAGGSAGSGGVAGGAGGSGVIIVDEYY